MSHATCDETPINLGVACGNQACTSSDYCTGSGPSYSWWSYPSSCTQVCDAAGACVPCTCTVTETVCDVGPTDQCCDAVCSPSSGCSTVSGSCGLGDSCGTNILSLANTCTGCGVNLANGACTAGTTTECSAASHSECETVSCNATPYYCTNAGGIWEWRTTIPCDDGDVCTTGDSCNLVAEICEGTLISCLPGGGCCTETCDSLSGCETIPITGGCPDECLASGLTVGKSCQSCGPEGATGTCDVGTVHTCSVAQQCEQHICGGTTYYCTGVSGPWVWSNDPTCDDGISSTTNDTCLPTEVCQGAPDWMYRRDVIVDSNDTVAHTNYQVLVVLNSSFNYANAETNGEDVRFTTDSSGLTFDLDHYIESWNVSGESRLWFKLPSLPAMTSTTVYMFYGKAGEPDGQVTFASMFPSAYVSTGSTTLTGTNIFDWFEVQTGHTVTVGAGQVLRIGARRIIVGGNISGNAAGNSASGTGGGSTTAGGGGGGYGGAGGQGGYDSGDSPGAGGSTHGSTATVTIDMGSKGGDTDSSVGGNGGGGVWLDASAITLGGNITVNGTAGASSGRSGGGGSGGGVLLVGDWLNGTGSISANGANGGSGTTANDGGGGGGGGRVKVFYDSTNALTGSVSISAGSGGCCGDSDYGDPGSTGTDNQATATYKTSATLGTETVM